MRRTQLLSAVLFVFGIATLAGCANTDTTNPTDTTKDGETRSAGIALTSDTLADTDVSRMQFDIRGVSCDTGEPTGFSDQEVRDLADTTLPGGISKFENAPFDADSQHLFADAFFLVDAGCYNVTTTPLDNQGNASSDCNPASRNRVSVEDGQTTEILLINQCRGAQRGGLDVISAINNPPELENLEFQKFLSSCPPEGQPTDEARRVCATAFDANNDGLEFEWSAIDAGGPVGDIVSTEQTQLGNNRVQSCAQLAINQAGEYQFRVRVFDLDGQGNRMEQILTEQEGQNVTSRDSLQFPIYSSVDCPAEPEQPEVRGRSVTMLMALSAAEGGDIPWLIQNSVQWVSPLDDPRNSRILYILDNSATDKFLPEDRDLVLNVLREEGIEFEVDDIVEPEGGVTPDQLEGYDVVWFANPDRRMDDTQTFDSLIEFQADDGGLILQGEDMARAAFEDGARTLRTIHRLNFVNDGRRACGDIISLDSGNVYDVQYTDEPLMVLDELRGRRFTYPSDIDRVRPTLSGEIILANKSYSRGDCSVRAPAVSAIDPEATEEQ